jgi:Family of unknown function (DUF5330)
MGFLIRTAFWFSLVLLLLPFGGDGSSDDLGPLQALLAAREAVQDISGICERKPEVCKAGRSALHTIGVKAKAGAKLAYDMIDDEQAEPVQTADPTLPSEVAPDTTIETGTVAATTPAAVKPKKK